MIGGSDDRAEILPAGTQLRLLRDRLLVRPLEWSPSVIIATIRHGRPLRGVVIAVGPGRLYRKYRNKPAALRRNGLVQEQREFVETGTYIPVQVKSGDVIELGGLNIFDGQGYNFPQVIIGTERFLICQEQDVCFVHEPEVAVECTTSVDEILSAKPIPPAQSLVDAIDRDVLSEVAKG